MASKVKIPNTVDEILVEDQLRGLLDKIAKRIPETDAIVVVMLDKRGRFIPGYAGTVGMVSACGILSYGEDEIKRGKNL